MGGLQLTTGRQRRSPSVSITGGSVARALVVPGIIARERLCRLVACLKERFEDVAAQALALGGLVARLKIGFENVPRLNG